VYCLFCFLIGIEGAAGVLVAMARLLMLLVSTASLSHAVHQEIFL
jgi:hypothetical protein